MLRQLRVSEMRYRAVLEVLDGAVLNLEDRSSRPHRCPHQMAPELNTRVRFPSSAPLFPQVSGLSGSKSLNLRLSYDRHATVADFRGSPRPTQRSRVIKGINPAGRYWRRRCWRRCPHRQSEFTRVRSERHGP